MAFWPFGAMSNLFSQNSDSFWPENWKFCYFGLTSVLEHNTQAEWLHLWPSHWGTPEDPRLPLILRAACTLSTLSNLSLCLSRSLTVHSCVYVVMFQAPRSDKAKLMSRIAKMGQPMLPMVGAGTAAAQGDDEEGQVEYIQSDALIFFFFHPSAVYVVHCIV